MKSKMKGIMGIGFALVLVASMMVFALPVSAGPYDDLTPTLPNMWAEFVPTPGILGGWFNDPDITKVGPIAEAINGDLFASVNSLLPLGGTLGTSGGTSSATWSGGTYHSPDYSAELNFVDAHVYVDITAPATGYTPADLDAAAVGDFGFWYFQTAEAGFGPQLELKFDDPGSAAYMDVTFMLQANTTLNQWTWVDLGSTFGAIGTWDGTTYTAYASVQLAIDALVAGVPTYTLLKVRVELYNDPAPARICYIDDVRVAGSCYTFDPAMTFFKSIDGGRTWFPSTLPGKYAGGPVVDMVCSSLSEDVLYVTDGNYVYKSVDGGMTFMLVAKDSLEYELRGQCGVACCGLPITCIDLAYDGGNEPVVFIGTRNVGNTYVAPHPDVGRPVVGSVYWISDETFPAEWADLQVRCYGCCDITTADDGCWDVYAVGAAPDFPVSNKAYALITTDDSDCDGIPNEDTAAATPNDNRTQVVSTVGTTCSWTFVGELFWDCDPVTPKDFEINHASRFAFGDDFTDARAMFIGVTAYESGSNSVPGGDVYRVDDTFPLTPTLDLNVQGFYAGCLGLADANICSLDMYGATESGSLIAGAYNNYQPIGAAYIGTNVWYSTDGGWTWNDSDKDPTGVDRTYVIWYADTALAGTRHCDCAISMSCGDEVGKYFNQIALINMTIDEVLDLTHAPGYLPASSIMYVLTYDEDSCLRSNLQPSTSLFRWDGTYWERVYSSLSWEYDIMMDWAEVSPDFNDTGCVYLANTNFQMFRTLDQGCSWRVLAYPCAPLPTISAWIVVDEETVLAAGGGGAPNNGLIWKTDRHGTRPWSAVPTLDDTGTKTSGQGVDFDLSPNIGTDTTVLFSDDAGRVFISQDLSTTPWSEITDIAGSASFNGAHNTYCVFDPGYGTAGDPGENMIYAAAGSVVGRCNLNLVDFIASDQDWVYISNAAATCDPFDLCLASGIDAAGDTALYVADAGTPANGGGSYLAEGTIGVRYGCPSPTALCTCDLEITDADGYNVMHIIDGTFELGEPLSIIEYNLECDYSGGTTVIGEILVLGLINGGMARIDYISEDETPCGVCEPDGIAVEILYSYLTVTDAPAPSAYCPTGVWRTLNPMDLMPPVFPYPLVEWEFLSLDATHQLRHPEAGLAGSTGVYPDDLWLTSGTNVLWALDRTDDRSIEDIYMWIDPLAAPVIQIQPADGALLPTTHTATIEWQPLDNATLYEVFVYSFCAACPDNMVIDHSFETALTCVTIEGLTPGMKYFWKVRVACDSPYVSKWSTLRSFDTALGAVPYLCSPWCGQDDVILTTNYSWDAVIGATSYEVQVVAASADGTADWTGATTLTTATNAMASIPGLEYSTVYYWRVRAVSDGVYSAWAVCIFTTAAEPAEPVEPPPTVDVIIEEITPMWIWVIIGIGGALTIAVIILIVTTRRVP